MVWSRSVSVQRSVSLVFAIAALTSFASAEVNTIATPSSPLTPATEASLSTPAMLTTTTVTTSATATATASVVAPAVGSAYWTVATQPQKLKDYSDRKFDAYTITLTNTQPFHVQILQGEVANALNEQQLVAEKSKGGSGGGRILGNLALGAASTGMHFAGLGAGSMGAFRALSMGQNAIGVASNAINHTPQGNFQITGKYIQRFNEVVLGQNQSFTFDVVMPKDQNPNLRLVFKNLETNQILDFAK
ncbi:MAG: hypothetical protein QE263_05135 [Vampirovibrionales bacterium]|nr:hypothetical protein [Vampirovibrionales bacterium]